MNATKGIILIVDDMPTNLNVLLRFLESAEYKVLVATDGESAIEQAEYVSPDIILLDVMMPGIDGFETCRRLKASDISREIPVIFMTALSEIVDKVHGFQLGAADYITKPFQHEEVLARIQTHLKLQAQRRSIEELSNFKDEMLRIVSHDLKNPISVVQGYADLLLDEITSEKRRDYVEYIQRSSQKMLNLVTDLLDMAAMEGLIPLELRLLPVASVLADCIENYRLLAQQKQIDLRYHAPDADLLLWLDPERFAQAVNNLISNAIKYTLEGGRVTLETTTRPNEFLIQVADTGAGIPVKFLPYLFDKFYRVKTAKHLSIEGSGLGLAIAKAIVEKHHGKISVESEPGKGSVFSIMLPLE